MSKREMLTTGVDIIEVERVQQVLDRWGQRFLDRIFTEGEQTYCRGRAPNLAARFAAKEATMKALGTGVRGVSWKDIEVVRARSGAPSIRLTGRAQQRFESLGLSHLALSMSHTKGNAVAMVVGQTES
jgi:holo-[acyl-carrier protein] synthase